jgi:hypothetical protein
MSKKIEKMSLNLSQKIQLCKHSRDNKPLKQSDLVDWVSKKFDLKVDRSTVSKILKNSESILESTKSSAIRSKVVKFPKLEEMLREWFLRTENITIISDAMIVEKGKEITQYV